MQARTHIHYCIFVTTNILIVIIHGTRERINVINLLFISICTSNVQISDISIDILLIYIHIL